MKADRNQRLCDVVLDETIGRSTPDVEHERAVAIFDLLEENLFEPAGHPGGPYKLNLSLVDAKLVFAISTEKGDGVATHILSLTPFRRIVKDYFMICESYYEAIRSATPVASSAPRASSVKAEIRACVPLAPGAWGAVALFAVAGMRMIPSVNRFQSIITQTASTLPHAEAVITDIQDAQGYVEAAERLGLAPAEATAAD